MEEIVYVMEDFIKTYDNVLDRQFCNTLIEKLNSAMESKMKNTVAKSFYKWKRRTR